LTLTKLIKQPVCIILHVEIRNTGIALRLEWANHIYLDLAHKLFGSFTDTLCSLKNIVERPIRTVDMSSRNDRDQVNQWNISDLTRVDVCLHNQVESQCRAHPDMLAIESWDGKLAYGELRSLSSSLSAYLLSLGVEKGTMVAVCLEKSKWTIVAMLAILKAGAVCVPMDPKYPMGRLKTIMRNTKATFILTSHGNEKFQLEEGFQNVCVGPALIETLPINNQLLDLYCQSTDAAFVIYTSGSTGNPKGIVLEHGSLCTGAAAHAAIMKLDETSRVLQFASYSFDISICEIFTTLIHGGCVCVPSERERLNDLSAAIASLGVTHLCLTATVAKLLHPTDIPSVKTLSVSGEPMSREIISTWAPSVQLINMYGPAECTIWCTARDCVEYGSDPQNTGRPLRSAIWITDIENNETLLPIGAVGELLIEGWPLRRRRNCRFLLRSISKNREGALRGVSNRISQAD
jgi:amino acid adenylation domain-containing protein